jgi:hypothetical protein
MIIALEHNSLLIGARVPSGEGDLAHGARRLYARRNDDKRRDV